MTLPVTPLTAQAFARYGSVLTAPEGAPTAEDATFAYWSDLAHYLIEGETEMGLCTVYRRDAPRVTWFERHARTPEILIPIDAPFVLPVRDGETIEVFRVAPGESVVLGRNVWHSACLPVDRPRTSYFVLFRRGTPYEDVVRRDVPPVAVDV